MINDKRLMINNLHFAYAYFYLQIYEFRTIPIVIKLRVESHFEIQPLIMKYIFFRIFIF